MKTYHCFRSSIFHRPILTPTGNSGMTYMNNSPTHSGHQMWSGTEEYGLKPQGSLPAFQKITSSSNFTPVSQYANPLPYRSGMVAVSSLIEHSWFSGTNTIWFLRIGQHTITTNRCQETVKTQHQLPSQPVSMNYIHDLMLMILKLRCVAPNMCRI